MHRVWQLPSPIKFENTLAIASSSPGFSHDLTRWELRISTYGLLVQNVEVAKYHPVVVREKNEHIVELPEGYCDELVQFVDQIGFAHFADRYPTTWDDLPIHWIGVRLSDGTPKTVFVECDPNRTGQAAEEVERFFKLWKVLHRHAPYSGAYHERSKRQLKLDARRERRAKKKE